MYRPEGWETPSTFEAEDWLKEALERFREDRKLYGNQADSGELESARLALTKDESFQHGYEAGADAMHKADIKWILEHVIYTSGVFSKEDWMEFVS